MDLFADAAWELTGVAPGAVAAPAGLADLALTWVPAIVPGTVAQAARAARAAGAVLDASDSAAVDGNDWWLRTEVSGAGPHLLCLDGLATVADVWVGDEHVLRSENMFRAHRLTVQLAGRARVTIRCAAPLVALGRRPRPRWKSTLVGEQRWRWLRTTVLGRIATWAGPIAPAGVWRPARLLPLDTAVVATHRVSAELVDGDGRVAIELDVRGPCAAVTASVGEHRVALARGANGRWSGSLVVPDPHLWWPHTHGAQPLLPVTVSLDDGAPRHLTSVGFRRIEADTTGDGFRLIVNGVGVFARGAVWEPLDPIGFASDPDAVRAALTTLRDGGHNLVRVPGTGVYETEAFHAACDELGLLVWQDCMLTTLDPPDTEEFTAELVADVTQLADRLAGHPSTAVVCGGAETEQQPAMLGLGRLPIPALTDTIPGVLADRLPGIPYVTGSPSGGALPTHTGSGIAQYFGVGAYLRPLPDVRAAGVRFAGESLAFSIPPEQHGVLAAFGSARIAGHDPQWKTSVPRDPTASWDFEDVRDHYVAELFGVDPRLERYSDADRYLDLGRAAVCVAMTEVLSWWRRPRSGCAGAIVLAARDLTAGSGWGVVDAAGRPKAPWFALRPVLAPTALLVGDDGADGLSVTVVRDRSEPLAGTLHVTTWSPAGAVLDEGQVPVTVPAHGAVEVSLDAVLGRFTDASHYYRFGPRSRDVVSARFVDTAGTERATHTALLGHHLRVPTADPRTALSAQIHADDAGWVVEVEAASVVQWLAIDSATHEPHDSWFHLAPGERRRVRLDPQASGRPGSEPQVSVRALNVTERNVPVTPDRRVAPDPG